MIDVNDGRERVGFLKPLSGGGFELFIPTADEEIYIGKSRTMREGAALIREALAARAAAPQELGNNLGEI
jgi:hypothetical protein